MAIKEWTSYYPALVDNTTASGMQNLENEVDDTRVSQIHAVRDGLIAVQNEVGATTAASGTLRYRVQSLEDNPIGDNIPVFSRDSSDSSLIKASAALGSSSQMSVRLNDGIRRTASLPLYCDIDLDGIGGRDTGDSSGESAGDLYHIYAVVSDTDEYGIKLVLSKDAVPGTSGPPSFSIYLYLWTIRVSAISPVVIEKFEQVGKWYRPLIKNDTNYSIDSFTGTSPTTGWNDVSSTLQALIPESSNEVDVEGWLSTASLNQYIFIAGEATPSWTPDYTVQPYSTRFLAAEASAYASKQTRRVATLSRGFSVWYENSVTTYSTVQLSGYRNSLYPGD